MILFLRKYFFVKIELNESLNGENEIFFEKKFCGSKFSINFVRQDFKTIMMSDYKDRQENEIFTRVLKAGRRTYFFDVRETKAGDYYLTITESKKTMHENGEATFEKHKIYLYKEDFKPFQEMLAESCDFILTEKGTDVISEKHDKNFKSRSFTIESDDEI